MSYKKRSLHIASWNINGYTYKGFNKFQDRGFIEEIENKDIICLMETHCALESSISLPRFKAVHLVRPKSRKTNKRSGGISVLVKTLLKPGIKFLEHTNDNYIWLKLCKTFFGLSSDIYVCFTYDPPAGSSYSQSLQEDILDLVEKDIFNFSQKGQIILAGDFNARTGSNEQDFIVDEKLDENDYIPLFDQYSPDIDIPSRLSMDSIISSRGKTLNELCIQSGIRILNGRISGDFTGQYTCYTPRGSSVVDYFIVSENLLRNITFFSVHNLCGDLSDHCQISVMLNISCMLQNKTEVLNSMPPQFIWNDDSSVCFQEALSSPDLKNKITHFENHDFGTDTDSMVSFLNNIFSEAASKSLKLKNNLYSMSSFSGV